MKFRIFGVRTPLASLLLLSLLSPGFLLAQAPTGSVRGQITDPSGASVPAARVAAVSSTGQAKLGVVRPDGTYEIQGLAPGSYTIKARAKGFTTFEQANVQVAAGKVGKVDISLKIKEEVEKVEVTEESTKVSVNPQENASALVIKGEDLKALSDDPDELQSELEALAGPSAGPNGGQIYVDGFTGGQLPPKADILEIRINQNPFSAEYDKVGYGRIEITTRPGASKLHGQLMGDINASPLNTRSPFAPTQEPGYHTDFFNASIGGPLSKKASFFFTIFRRDIGDNSIVSASILSPTLTQTS
ncbi:MAG: carboxypeptidase-like regulatory domain-containing protein, partial [Acidobacteriota bacterium]|nr:carboxypeptidase-like regulatory domain-containing protein [Acidobacteriota bacterium]